MESTSTAEGAPCSRCRRNPRRSSRARLCDDCASPRTSSRARAQERGPRRCRCGGEPRNAMGPPVCDVCHHAAKGATKHRTCAQCEQPFKTSNNSTTCNSCAHQRRKTRCACGAEMDPRAKRCRACEYGDRAGEKAGAWKGGRRKMTGGYITIYQPAHPRAHANGYVPEHTLVMEQQLGRYLVPGETAHHKNGKRDDNRPENLELWARSQPAGQRAADLLAWAYEIIERYGAMWDHAADSPRSE